MKSHLLLWKEVAEELGDRCGANTNRDFETVSVRFENEGSSFLRITLPDFCKDFERSLDQGRLAPDLFANFKRVGAIPVFLQGFTERVFDSTTGFLVEEPDVEAIYAVRQLTLLFSKVDSSCTPERDRAAFSGFLDVEQEVRAWTNKTPLDGENLHRFKVVSALLFGDVFDRLNREVRNYELIPKHSSGATANRLMGNQKFVSDMWTQRLEEVFPSSDYLIPSHRFYKNLESVELLEPGAEMPVRVITVPKTMKSPRIIAVEPAHMQYAQQGVLEAIRRNWDGDFNVANQFIRDDDQESNRLLAQLGSRTGSLATLDLSEASDRVPLSVVSEMLTPWPDLKDAVMASRSLTADVPGYGIIPLSKFASMGSALCFPMESFVFLTSVFMGIERATGSKFSSVAQFSAFKMMVRVYGDDIVCPVEVAPSVVEILERVFPFKVNSRKSFWTGKFRESCGGDYYDGVDVSVVRVRSEFPDSRADSSEIVSLVSLRNQMYFSGLWRTTAALDRKISGLIKHFPVVKETSSALGRHTLLPVEKLEYGRISPTLQRPEVKAYKVRTKLPHNPLDGVGALLKFFLKRGEDPILGDHLTRSGRSLGVSIQPGWAPLA